MKVPATIAVLCARDGGTLEGDRKGGTWWREGLFGPPTLTWRWLKDGRCEINCTPRKG